MSVLGILELVTLVQRQFFSVFKSLNLVFAFVFHITAIYAKMVYFLTTEFYK